MTAMPTVRETSHLRSAAVAARVGRWLGICFGIAFLTGLVSHYAQNPTQPIPFPTSPAWGYRLTQGLHVTTGIACIPLLLVKLWSVLPLLVRGLPSGWAARARDGARAGRASPPGDARGHLREPREARGFRGFAASRARRRRGTGGGQRCCDGYLRQRSGSSGPRP